MKHTWFISLVIFLSLNIIGFTNYAQNTEFNKSNFPDQKNDLRKAKKNLKDGDNFFMASNKGSYAEALDYYLKANNFNPKNADLNFRIGICFLKSYYKNLALEYLNNAYQLNPGISDQLFLYLGEANQFQSRFSEALSFYVKYKESLTTKELAVEGTMIDKRIRECNSGLLLASNPNVIRFDKFTEKVNSPWDEYCPVINKDENMMAFTSRRNTSTGGRINPLDYLYFEDIFFTFRDDRSVWSAPENPGKPLNGKTNDATVDMSPDGDLITLYKNIGHKDFICESQKKNEKWEKPVKLNKEINKRRFHEPSAAFTLDRKTIYFISDQNGGFGGSDIYLSQQNANGEWGDAVNLGNILNSPYDEEAPFLYKDSTLYFSSKGFNSVGGYDIFMSEMQSDGQWSAPVNLGFPLNSPGDDLYMVVSKNEDAYLSSDRQDGFGGFDIYHAKVNFDVRDLMAQVAPVFLQGTIIDEQSADGIVALVDIHDQSGTNLVPFGTSDNMGQFVASLPSMKSYYLSIQPDGCDSATTVIRQFGTVYHPDYQPAGSDSIARTTISGIIADSKSGRPYQFPIEIIDQKNLKVVVRIIPDTNGAFYAELPSASSYHMKIISSGCSHAPVVVSIPEKFTTSFASGMTVNIENIYFDFDRAYIRADASEILDRHVLLFSRFPDWKILVGGHTDNMGSDVYNQFLSKKRAKAVMEYMVEKGVKKSQFKLAWYGYNNPATANTTEQGRQLNRRCEFTIVKE